MSSPPVLNPNDDTNEITINEEVSQLRNKVGLKKLSINPVQKPPLSFLTGFGVFMHQLILNLAAALDKCFSHMR